MEKRKIPGLLGNILELDVSTTSKLVDYLLKFPIFKVLYIHSTLLDLSCNGMVWFPIWIASIWFWNSRDLFEMQVNMLIGLIFDVIIVALLKAYVRRRRPASENRFDMLGPDKFSFPSGHSSRAFLILMFFTVLWPLPKICWLPLIAWANCVAISRLVMRRHYILDIFGGVLISVVEVLILKLLWVGKSEAIWLIELLASDPVVVDDE